MAIKTIKEMDHLGVETFFSEASLKDEEGKETFFNATGKTIEESEDKVREKMSKFTDEKMLKSIKKYFSNIKRDLFLMSLGMIMISDTEKAIEIFKKETEEFNEIANETLKNVGGFSKHKNEE